MRNSSLRLMAALALIVSMSGGKAWARSRGHEHGKTASAEHKQILMQRDHRGDADRDRMRHEWQRRARERREHRFERARSARPAGHARGWDRGRKTGWHNSSVPPGRANAAGAPSTFKPQAHGHAVDARRAAAHPVPVSAHPQPRDRVHHRN